MMASCGDVGVKLPGSVTCLGLFLSSSFLVRKDAAVDKFEVCLHQADSSPKCQAVLVWLSGRARQLLLGDLGGLCTDIQIV